MTVTHTHTHATHNTHTHTHTLTQAAAAWALGQIGRHTPEHAKAVAQAKVLPRLLELHLGEGSSEDLQAKVREGGGVRGRQGGGGVSHP